MNSSEAFLMVISAFDTTGSKTADKVFLDCDKKNNNWHCCKQRGCKQILPFHHIVAIEDCNTDCQRFQDICRNQCQSNGIFVPCIDEYENQCSYDTRCCYRQKDADQGRNLSAAVYGSCLFHFRRNGDKGTAQQPDCKCLVKCCIDKYQPYETVCHAKSGHDFVDTYQKDNRCKHLRDDNDSQEDFFTLEFHSCKRISCRDTARSRSDCNDQGRTAGKFCQWIGRSVPSVDFLILAAVVKYQSGKRCQLQKDKEELEDIFKVHPPFSVKVPEPDGANHRTAGSVCLCRRLVYKGM